MNLPLNDQAWCGVKTIRADCFCNLRIDPCHHIKRNKGGADFLKANLLLTDIIGNDACSSPVTRCNEDIIESGARIGDFEIGLHTIHPSSPHGGSSEFEMSFSTHIREVKIRGLQRNRNVGSLSELCAVKDVASLCPYQRCNVGRRDGIVQYDAKVIFGDPEISFEGAALGLHKNVARIKKPILPSKTTPHISKADRIEKNAWGRKAACNVKLWFLRTEYHFDFSIKTRRFSEIKFLYFPVVWRYGMQQGGRIERGY